LEAAFHQEGGFFAEKDAENNLIVKEKCLTSVRNSV